jgi:uncharacterized protein YvpB
MRSGRFIIPLLVIFILMPTNLSRAASNAASSVANTATVPSDIDVSRVTGRAVVGHAQTYNLDCEARSASDLAGYWGVQIDEKEFLRRLPRSDNPEVGFVGDPNGKWGNIPPMPYGVHAGPVAALLHEYGLPARAVRGMDWHDMQTEIAAGRPVIVWIIGQMWDGRRVRYVTRDGHLAKVANYEHTMILVGYNRRSVEAVDAFTGRKERFKLADFLHSWAVLGNMAVVLKPAAPTPTPTPTLQPNIPHRPVPKFRVNLANQPHKIFLTTIMQGAAP